MNDYSLTLYFPLFNEEEGVRNLYNEIKKNESGFKEIGKFSIVFIDDGSTDKTLNLLKKYFSEKNFKIIIHNNNKNLGGFLRTAISDCDTEFIGFLDSDLSYSIPTFLEMVKKSQSGFDIVNASPYHPKGSVVNVSKLRLIPSIFVNFIYRFLTKKEIYTSSSICKIYRLSLLKKVKLENEGFVTVVELLTKASLLTESFYELPCTLKGRVYGTSKIKFVKVVFGHLSYILSFYKYINNNK